MRGGRGGGFGWLSRQPPPTSQRFLGPGIGSGVGGVGIGSSLFGLPRVGGYHGNTPPLWQQQPRPRPGWPVVRPPPSPAPLGCWAAAGRSDSKRGRFCGDAASAVTRRPPPPQQPPPPQPPLQSASQPRTSGASERSAAVKALHQAVQEAGPAAAPAVLESLLAGRRLSGQPCLGRAYGLLRDLHPVARQQVEAAAASPPDDVGPLTVLCDIYVNGAFGCQGRGPSMWAAEIDACARLADLLLGNRVLVVKQARRLGRDGRFESVPAIAGPNTPDRLPPLLWQPGPDSGGRALAEARLGSVSCCLLGFQEFDRLVGRPEPEVRPAVASAVESELAEAELDWPSDPLATEDGVLGNLFVFQPPGSTADPVAALKATLQFNGVESIEVAHIAEKFGVAAQLQLRTGDGRRHLLALGEGPSVERAVAAAAAALLEAAGRHRPRVGVAADGEDETNVLPVTRAGLLASGEAAYAADPTAADRALSRALSDRAGLAGGAWALLSGADLWPELLRGRGAVGLADFARRCAAHLSLLAGGGGSGSEATSAAAAAATTEEEEAEAAVAEFEFSADEFCFAEQCVVYCLCAVLGLRVRAATAAAPGGGGGGPRQRLLVQRAAPPEEVKRQLRLRGRFGRLRLLLPSPRPPTTP